MKTRYKYVHFVEEPETIVDHHSTWRCCGNQTGELMGTVTWCRRWGGLRARKETVTTSQNGTTEGANGQQRISLMQWKWQSNSLGLLVNNCGRHRRN